MSSMPMITPGNPPANFQDYMYVSAQSTNQVGVFINVAGVPTDPDNNIVMISFLPDEPDAQPVFAGRQAIRQTIGTYTYNFLSQDTASPGHYHLAWAYQINGVPDVFMTPIEIGNYNPAYDQLAPEAKFIIDLVWSKFCVDEETEILTKNGWKNFETLKVGDETLTLNHLTGISEWQPVTHIHTMDVIDEPMLSLEKQNHSSLTTLWHKWPTLHTKRKKGDGIIGYERVWKQSYELNTNDGIITSALHDSPSIAKYDDAFVELVGWFWTEGSIITKPTEPQIIHIGQSQTVNPQNVDRIRNSLTQLFGEQRPSDQKIYNSVPSWSERNDKTHISFTLNAAASKDLLEVAPNKVISIEFLSQLTQAQLLLLIHTSMSGDSHINKLNSWQISQSDYRENQGDSHNSKDRLDAFDVACILAGKTPRRRTYNEVYKDVSYKKYNTTVEHSSLARFHQKDATITSYTGKIWCPTTENHTWLARRHGTVFFTGNCDGYDSEFGGPNVRSYFQSHFDRGRLAQLLYMRLQTINIQGQPVNSWSLTAGNAWTESNEPPLPGSSGTFGPGTSPPSMPPGTSPPWPPYGTPSYANTPGAPGTVPATPEIPSGPAFPYYQWSGLLISGLTIDVIKHLMRVYVEEPQVEGSTAARMSRRDYMQRWGEILRTEEEEYTQMLEVFKVRQMFALNPKVLVAGGVYGNWTGPTRLAGNAAARPRYFARFY